jgi:hypothetical protein
MSFDLTNKNISDTFQNLLQITGSNNNLHDLIGNPIINLTISGALHAQSYIVSQSIVNVSSGSTIFGNTTDDSHIFIGNITASGAISSSSGISEFDKVLTTGFRIRRPEIGTVHSVIVPHGGRANEGDITFTIPGDISASGDLYAGDGIVLGGYLRTTWPSAGSEGDWYDTGTNAQTSSKDVIVDGFISASSLEVDSVDPTEDFFLLKSGSLNALKLNNEGVLQLGSFTFTPTAVSGGIYYDKNDDEFYLGKENN